MTHEHETDHVDLYDGDANQVYDKYIRRKTVKDYVEEQIKRSPWWLIALILHSVVIAILMHITFIDHTEREERVIVQTEMFDDIPKPETKDVLKDILEEKVVEVDTDVQAPDVEDPAPNDEVQVEEVSVADINIDSADLGEIADMGLGDVGSMGGVGDSGALAGMLGHGNGQGGLGKGSKVKYMGTEAKGRHFAFLIDYSASLKEEQLEVAKFELQKAINSFDAKAKVALIFFSGPAWVPVYNGGDIREHLMDLRTNWDSKDASDFWLKPGKQYEHAKWISPTRSKKKELTKIIMETPKTGGTDWRHPFAMAFNMNPKPDVIYFMTDGKCRATQETLDMIKMNTKTKVNTIAFGLQPQLSGPLQEMADLTRGKFKSYSMDDIKKMYNAIKLKVVNNIAITAHVPGE